MQQPLKILGIVVTYYPNIEDCISNIEKYIGYIDHLIFWINTPDTKSSEYEPFIEKYRQKITFMGTSRNEGIGYALNRAIDYGKEHGFTHLLTMDQDSIWVNFHDYVANIKNNVAKYSIFAPTVRPTFDNQAFKPTGRDIIEQRASITSGTAYAIELFKATGKFNEKYFIDAVDTEFGYRAFANGFPTARFSDCLLMQNIGNNLTKGNFHTVSYSATRIYYIMRNHPWMWRQHPKTTPKGMKKWIIFSFFLRRIPKIILIEPDKISKLTNLFKGLFDGLFRKYPSYPI